MNFNDTGEKKLFKPCILFKQHVEITVPTGELTSEKLCWQHDIANYFSLCGDKLTACRVTFKKTIKFIKAK